MTTATDLVSSLTFAAERGQFITVLYSKEGATEPAPYTLRVGIDREAAWRKTGWTPETATRRNPDLRQTDGKNGWLILDENGVPTAITATKMTRGENGQWNGSTPRKFRLDRMSLA